MKMTRQKIKQRKKACVCHCNKIRTIHLLWISLLFQHKQKKTQIVYIIYTRFACTYTFCMKCRFSMTEEVFSSQSSQHSHLMGFAIQCHCYSVERFVMCVIFCCCCLPLFSRIFLCRSEPFDGHYESLSCYATPYSPNVH